VAPAGCNFPLFGGTNCWLNLEHDAAAAAAERAVIFRRRGAGLAPVATAPVDGRSETAPIAALSITHAYLVEMLGAPSTPRALDDERHEQQRPAARRPSRSWRGVLP
jgi:hypothetical protein